MGKSAWIDQVVGFDLGEDAWLQTMSRNQSIAYQTDLLVKKLLSVGTDLYRSKEDWIWLVNDEGFSYVLPSSKYCHQQFLPIVQQSEVRLYVKDLEYFLERNPYCRMMVITVGDRVLVDGIKQRIHDLNYTVNRFAKFSRKHDVSVDFSRVEITINENEGVNSYHIHAHIIYHPLRKLNKNKWQKYLVDAHKRFSGHFKDCGKLHSIKEVTKYLTKINKTEEGEGIGLLDLSAYELQNFHSQVFKQRLISRFNVFKSESADRKNKGLKLKKIKIPENPKKMKWVLVKVGKAKSEKVKSEKSEEDKKIKEDFEEKNKQAVKNIIKNQVLGETVGALNKPILQKCYIVKNYTSFEGVKMYIDYWKRQNPFNVHTSTITGSDFSDSSPPKPSISPPVRRSVLQV